MDCGTFKKFVNEKNHRVTPQNEFELHRKYLQIARNFLKCCFVDVIKKDIKFKAYLMDLDGNCKEVPLEDQK